MKKLHPFVVNDSIAPPGRLGLKLNDSKTPGGDGIGLKMKSAFAHDGAGDYTGG